MATPRWLLLFLCSWLLGCQAPMQLPDGFLRLQQRPDFTAVTPDDGQLRLRWFVDPDEGELPFWVDLFRRTCTEQRGYTAVADGAVTDALGRTGHWLEFQTTVDGEPIGYLASLFVQPAGWFHRRHLVIAEFGVPEPVFAARVEAVRDSLRTVRL